MHCKSCNYALWRLKTRTCPECGAPFKPSEHIFEPNSIRFRCPHCTQEYYGTDPNGLLSPREFDCVRCNAHIHMDEMVLEPAAGLSDEGIQRTNPWLSPEKMGRFTRWIKTVGMTLGRPTDLIRGTPRGRSGAAIWFAVRSNMTYTVIGMAPLLLLPVLFGLGAGAGPGGGTGMVGVVTGVAVGLLTWLAGLAISLCVGLGLWIMLAHAILRLTGRVSGTMGDTGECLCYASGANVLAAIPCLGMHASVVSWIWPAISGALMLKERHKVSGLRAACATVAPPLVITVGAVALFFWFMTWSMGRAGGFAGAMGGNMTGFRSAMTVGAMMSNHETVSAEGAPSHAGALVAQGLLAPDDLTPISGPSAALIPVVDGFSLKDLESAISFDHSDSAALLAFRAGVPDDAPAYRLGDFVFLRTPNATPGSGLWKLIILPQGGMPDPTQPITVLTDAGMPQMIVPEIFQSSLQSQNDLRELSGLAPIPDPASIPHDQRGWTPPPPPIDAAPEPAPAGDPVG